MSGRIETFDSRKEQTSKWSQNEAFSVREAGVDIGKSGGQGGSNVSVDQVVTSGREVAGVTVDGERTPILIPNAGEWTQSDWAETDPSDDAFIKNKPSLAQVATSGDYGDLSNTPDLSDFVEDPNYVHTDYNYDIGAKSIVDHVTDDLAGKVDKVSGKQLSDNNFTNAQKDKLTNLADIYGVGSNLTLDPETNILSANAQPITIDDEMSSSSTNAVQNRVITSALADKVDKVTGKVLSDNNFSNADKQKLDGIDQGAEVNDISSITVNGTRINPDQDKNVSITVPVNTLYADAPIGSISPFGGATIPDGYFLCNGQAISRTVYSDLFSVIGTSFGSGDGSTTFNVPDLRGEFIRGAGANSHANQGNGGTVGAHQDATYQPSVMCSNNNIGYLDSNLDGDNNSVRDQDKNVTRTPSGVVSGQTQTITKYQVSGSRGTTSSTEIGFYARPTNTSVNFIIKAMHSSMPIDVADYVDDAIDDAFATLATVATSGSYADLSNTPEVIFGTTDPASNTGSDDDRYVKVSTTDFGKSFRIHTSSTSSYGASISIDTIENGAVVSTDEIVYTNPSRTYSDFTVAYSGQWIVRITTDNVYGYETGDTISWQFYEEKDVTLVIDPPEVYAEYLKSNGIWVKLYDKDDIPAPNTFDSDDFTVTNNEVSIIPAQRIFTGTQAQWNSLSLAEKKSYGQANITDDGSGGGGSDGGAIYTTTEQVVGTYLGKPLYQITIPFSGINTTANVWYALDISSYLDNPEIVFNISDMDYYFVSGLLRMFSNTSYESPNILLQTQVNRTDISGHVTVRYTKTTD